MCNKTIERNEYIKNNIFFKLKKINLTDNEVIQGVVLPITQKGTIKIDFTKLRVINLMTRTNMCINIGMRNGIEDLINGTIGSFNEIDIKKANSIYKDFIEYTKKTYDSIHNTILDEEYRERCEYYELARIKLCKFKNKTELEDTIRNMYNDDYLDRYNCSISLNCSDTKITNNVIEKISFNIKKDLGKYTWKNMSIYFTRE